MLARERGKAQRATVLDSSGRGRNVARSSSEKVVPGEWGATRFLAMPGACGELLRRDIQPLMPRLLLIVVLINGLAPVLGEAVELVVHYGMAGHLAHFEPGEEDLGGDTREHGCGPLAHHCGCCHSQSVVLTTPLPPELRPLKFDEPIPRLAQQGATGASRRLLRPPIRA